MKKSGILFLGHDTQPLDVFVVFRGFGVDEHSGAILILKKYPIFLKAKSPHLNHILIAVKPFGRCNDGNLPKLCHLLNT